jgi:hypothetical protein
MAGRMAVSGISMVLGPIDGYLALALAATGQTAAAGEAADRALALAEAWDLAVYGRWLQGHRTRHGF